MQTRFEEWEKVAPVDTVRPQAALGTPVSWTSCRRQIAGR